MRPLSPLRYPGSKSRMVPFIEKLLLNAGRGDIPVLVEPFMGGGAVTLGLLASTKVQVERVVIGDFDPLVHAFWQQAVHHAPTLVKAMYEEPVTVERWEHWKTSNPRSRLDRAVKFLFLNRTSFSGIVANGSGPIGGREQRSKYTIGCRFNKDRIAGLISAIGELGRSGRLSVAPHGPWESTVTHAGPAALVYADPPYLEQSHRLYGLGFTEQNHVDLARWLCGTTQPWILSYDNEPFIRGLYESVEHHVVPHFYSAGGTRKKNPDGREILFHRLQPLNSGRKTA